MRVARGGTGTLVAQEFLDDAPRHTPRSEMRGIGVPKRVHRGVFGEATLAHHELQGLLEGGRRERRLLVSSGEHTRAGGAHAASTTRHRSRVRSATGTKRSLPPCALSDTDQHALRINVRDLSAASLPVGAAHTPRSSADTCGLSSVVPRPAGSAPACGLSTTGSFWRCRGRMSSKTGHGRCSVRS